MSAQPAPRWRFTFHVLGATFSGPYLDDDISRLALYDYYNYYVHVYVWPCAAEGAVRMLMPLSDLIAEVILLWQTCQLRSNTVMIHKRTGRAQYNELWWKALIVQTTSGNRGNRFHIFHADRNLHMLLPLIEGN